MTSMWLRGSRPAEEYPIGGCSPRQGDSRRHPVDPGCHLNVVVPPGRPLGAKHRASLLQPPPPHPLHRSLCSLEDGWWGRSPKTPSASDTPLLEMRQSRQIRLVVSRHGTPSRVCRTVSPQIAGLVPATQKRSHFSHLACISYSCSSFTLEGAGRTPALPIVTPRKSTSNVQNLHAADASNRNVLNIQVDVSHVCCGNFTKTLDPAHRGRLEHLLEGNAKWSLGIGSWTIFRLVQYRGWQDIRRQRGPVQDVQTQGVRLLRPLLARGINGRRWEQLTRREVERGIGVAAQPSSSA